MATEWEIETEGYIEYLDLIESMISARLTEKVDK